MSDLHILDIEEDKNKTKVIHGQDITDCLKDNWESKKYSDINWKSCETMKRVGSIPWAVWLLWESLGITENPKELLKALERNPEFKTTDKRLI